MEILRMAGLWYCGKVCKTKEMILRLKVFMQGFQACLMVDNSCQYIHLARALMRFTSSGRKLLIQRVCPKITLARSHLCLSRSILASRAVSVTSSREVNPTYVCGDIVLAQKGRFLHTTGQLD